MTAGAVTFGMYSDVGLLVGLGVVGVVIVVTSAELLLVGRCAGD